ncbi:MAG: aspartate/glutamate racemase family protein [Syntrophaceae bacterium]|nr:aspartate/glutamate racemase family protein [Syntrophaceae bacterium]
MKTLGFIHTAWMMVEVIKRELNTFGLPVRAFHIWDESVLIDFMKAGEITPQVIRRLCHHAVSVEEAGADIIIFTCSSTSPAVDVVKRFVNRPVLKIDEPMAEDAVKKGRRIGIVATVATTLEPTSRLLKEKASEAGKEISISTALCEEAFQAILQGDTERHDRMVLEKAKALSREVDVLVLAQGSMARLAWPLGQQVTVPVISSPSLLMEKLRAMIKASEG